MNSNWNVVLNHSCLLGESPVWDPENKRILWVDILNGEIHQFTADTHQHHVINIGQTIGAVALFSSQKLLGALRNQFAFIDIEEDDLELIGDGVNVTSGYRFNDGKCDPAGRFWAGTMKESGKPRVGKLIVLEPELTTSVKIGQVTTFQWNGLE
jgi:sugar lactone lactonase YvrE